MMITYWLANNPWHKEMVNMDTPEGFKSFLTFDDAINYLWLNGEAEQAKELNDIKRKKQHDLYTTEG